MGTFICLQSFLTCWCPHNVDLVVFRALFSYAVIEMTTQVMHVNSPVPYIAGTHRQHGSCR